MADRKISELVALTSAVSSNDAIAIVDNSAAQTKKIDPKTLLEQAVKIIDAGSIPADKIGGATAPDGSITTAKLADRAVTAEKLDDNSSGVVSAGAPAAGIRIGQVAVDTTTNKFYVWSGSQWLLTKAAGSVNQIVGDAVGPIIIDTAVNGDIVTLDGYIEPTTNGAEFLAGPTAGGGDVTSRPIVGADLPDATPTSKGAVSVPGNGLTVNTGALSIDNTVLPNNAAQLHIVEYNEYGLVISGRTIEGGDLPNAQPGVSGVIKPGTGLAVDADGVLNHSNIITGGVATKVTFDAQGHITGTTPLVGSDIPSIPGSKITGDIDGLQLIDRSVPETKLADYSTCYVQEGNPGGGAKLGQFWFTPSTNQLRVYGRGSGEDLWLSVGFGALQAQNLRWAGTIDADTSTIVSLTSIGVSEGLTAGGPIPVPSDALSGVYFVTQVPGSNINEPAVQADTFTEGDWLLCVDQAQGYTHIDVAAGGGGGGGGAQYLDDLLDVEIGGTQTLFGLPRATLLNGQFLMYDSISGMWVNSAVLDGGSY